MTIDEARKVSRLMRIASRIGEPLGIHAWTLEGMRAALAREFPSFEWEVRQGEVVPFEKPALPDDRWFPDLVLPGPEA